MSPRGKVFKGHEFIADVDYAHRVRQNYETVRTLDGMSKIPSSAEVLLTISPTTAIGQYWSGAHKLTLHMSDGKKQDFFVVSPDGRCQATGGPY